MTHKTARQSNPDNCSRHDFHYEVHGVHPKVQNGVYQSREATASLSAAIEATAVDATVWGNWMNRLALSLRHFLLTDWKT